jgi:DnaJ like chaperone protein
LAQWRFALQLLAVLLGSVSTFQGALGASPSSSFLTPSGTVDIRAGSGAECGPDTNLVSCQVIDVDGKVLASDFIVSISAVFPSTGTPLLISATTSTGGNACCDTNYILDVSQGSPIRIKDFSFGDDVSSSNGDVIFSSQIGPNDLGDDTWGRYRYALGSGTPILIRKFVKYSTKLLGEKQFPWDVLNNPVLRAPILRVIGRSYYKQFRDTLSVASADELSIVEGRFLVGSGCSPRDCSDSQGFFVIDLERKIAWCAEYYAGSPKTDFSPAEPMSTKFWGRLTPDDGTPTLLITDWLRRVGVSWDQVTDVYLPPDVSFLYGTANTEIPTTSTKPTVDQNASINGPSSPQLTNAGPHLTLQDVPNSMGQSTIVFILLGGIGLGVVWLTRRNVLGWVRSQFANSRGDNQSQNRKTSSDSAGQNNYREKSKEENSAQSAPGDLSWWEVLSVPSDATLEQVKSAYRRLMAEYHPDKVATMGKEIRELAEKKSKQINQAYTAALGQLPPAVRATTVGDRWRADG